MNIKLKNILKSTFYNDPNEVDFLVKKRFHDNKIKIIMKDTMVFLWYQMLKLLIYLIN